MYSWTKMYGFDKKASKVRLAMAWTFFDRMYFNCSDENKIHNNKCVKLKNKKGVKIRVFFQTKKEGLTLLLSCHVDLLIGTII
jgi:hypothetical protein